MIGDKAYDSDKLDQKLKDEYGIEMIAPNRRNRGKTQDRRKLRRYKKRWKVERLFAWMHNFRRLVTRWESTSKTSSDSSNSLASICCSDVYETASSSLFDSFQRQLRLTLAAQFPIINECFSCCLFRGG